MGSNAAANYVGGQQNHAGEKDEGFDVHEVLVTKGIPDSSWNR